MLRVVINDFFNIEGGATSVSRAHAQRLFDLGFDVLFIAGSSSEQPLAPYAVRTVYPAGAFDSLKTFQRVVNYIYNIKVLFSIRRYLRDVNALERDCKIYVHSWTKVLSPALFSALRGFGDVELVSHDYFLHCPNGGYFNYNKGRVCDKTPLTTGCLFSNCDKRSRAQKFLRFFRFSVQKCTLRRLNFALTFVSEFQKSKCQNIGRVSALVRRELVLPNVLPPPEVVSHAGRNEKFLFVGRFEEEKGVRSILDALSLSGKECTFVGDGSLRELIQRHPLAELSREWLGQNGVRNHLASHRALIFASQWYEADPLICLEALSAGIPLVVTSVCAASQYIENYKNGIVYEASNVFQLSAILKRLSEDQSLVISLSRGGVALAARLSIERKELNDSYNW